MLNIKILNKMNSPNPNTDLNKPISKCGGKCCKCDDCICEECECECECGDNCECDINNNCGCY